MARTTRVVRPLSSFLIVVTAGFSGVTCGTVAEATAVFGSVVVELAVGAFSSTLSCANVAASTSLLVSDGAVFCTTGLTICTAG
jgi:hypothetical protein